MRADLHVHTTCSDGVWTPLEVARAAVAQRMDVLAITDHDALGGAEALAGEKLPLRVIPGVELSLRDMPGLHLLGYGVGAQAGPLRRRLRELASARESRAGEICRRLRALGYPLTVEELPRQGTVGRAHVARAMVERGWVSSTQEAFDRFLAEGAPAYVPGERLSMAEALELLNGCGVTPVLAHPALLPVDAQALPVLLRRWQEQGLQGVEVFHPAQAALGYGGLERQTRALGLLVTGGSDFHTPRPDRHGQLGAMIPFWSRAAEDVDALLKRVEGEAGPEPQIGHDRSIGKEDGRVSERLCAPPGGQ